MFTDEIHVWIVRCVDTVRAVGRWLRMRQFVCEQHNVNLIDLTYFRVQAFIPGVYPTTSLMM